MSKGIELTQSQIKAFENGAIMFLFPVLIGKEYVFANEEKDCTFRFDNIKEIKSICLEFPIQKGDKDIFVQEEFVMTRVPVYKNSLGAKNLNPAIWNNACEMTKEQSRYSFSECINVKVIRVQDIKTDELEKMDNIHITSLFQEMGINRTYKDNDYVFLVQFK